MRKLLYWVLPILLLSAGVWVSYETLDAGSSIQSLTTSASGQITAHQRDGTSEVLVTGSGAQSIAGIKTWESDAIFSSDATVNGAFTSQGIDDNADAEAIQINVDETTELSVRTDSDCGIGDVCSGEISGVFTNAVNMANFNLSNWEWYRIGDKVTLFAQGAITITNPGIVTTWEINLPFAPSPVFSSVGRVGGTGVPMDDDQGHFGCRPSTVSTIRILWQGYPQTAGTKQYSFTCSYSIK